MSGALLGALAGLVIAVVDFAFLTMIGRSLQLASNRGILRISAIVQLIAFPIIGWLLGPYLFGE